MQLVLGLTSGMQLRQIHDLVNVAEEMNIRKVWVGDDITGAHEIFTVVSTILLKHKNIVAGIGVTSPLIRNITTIARASATLAQIGGDNHFRLGLGVGGLQDLRKLGIIARNPASALRSASTLLREIWKSEKVTFEADDFKLNHYRSSVNVDRRVSILFGVRGPRLLNLAGEIADGIVLSGPTTYLRKAITLVRSSIDRSRRSIEDFTFVIWVPTMLVRQRSDLGLVKKIVAYVLSDTPKSVLEMAQLDLGKVEMVKKAGEHHGIAYATRLMDEALLHEIAVHGDAKQVCESLKAFERMGIQEVVFGPPYGARPHVALTEVANAWRD